MIESIPLRKIIRDPKCQPRVDGLDMEHVEELREAKANGATFPPIVVYREQFSLSGPENLYLSEGWHRFEVYDLDAEETIQAEVREGSLDDAIVNAMASNASHGLKRTRGDLGKAIDTMLAMKPDWSARELAAHLHCSFSYVASRRRDAEESEQKPKNPPKVQKPEKFKEVLAKAEVEATRTVERAAESVPAGVPLAAAVFEMKDWSKHFGSVVRMVSQAANLGGTHGSPEYREVINTLEKVQQFITRSLTKGK